jgi:hypothetical protein
MGYAIPDNHGLMVLTITNNVVAQPDTIRFGVKYNDVGSMADADFNRIANIVRDAFKAFYDSDWNVGPTKTYYAGGGTLFLSEDPTTETGTDVASVYASDNVAYIIQKKTASLGRAFRGRAYMPGVIESQVDEAGTVNPAQVTGFNTALGTFLTNFNADADVDYMALLHVEPTGDLPTAITSLSLASKVGTQRRRIRR